MSVTSHVLVFNIFKIKNSKEKILLPPSILPYQGIDQEKSKAWNLWYKGRKGLKEFDPSDSE